MSLNPQFHREFCAAECTNFEAEERACEVAEHREAKGDHHYKSRDSHVTDISNAPGDLCRLRLVSRIRTSRTPLRALRDEAQKEPYLQEWNTNPWSEGEPTKAASASPLARSKRSLQTKDAAASFAEDAVPALPGKEDDQEDHHCSHDSQSPPVNSLLPTLEQREHRRPASTRQQRAQSAISRNDDGTDSVLKLTGAEHTGKSLSSSRPATAPLNRSTRADLSADCDATRAVKTVFETDTATPSEDESKMRAPGKEDDQDASCTANRVVQGDFGSTRQSNTR